jgi:hypothetical protein
MALRSGRDFPPDPAPERIRDTSQGCRDALISANTSRGARKADLADQALAKLRLHALHAKLGGVIRELEETGNVMVGLIDESERQSGFWLVEMFRRLVHQAKHWRTHGERQGCHPCRGSRGGGRRFGSTGRERMSPSIADLLEQTNRELAGTDARVHRRVGEHLKRTGSALQSLQDAEKSESAATRSLVGQGSFLQQSVADLKRLRREIGINGYSRLQKKALAEILELHGVTPPPPPLESLTKKPLIALVRQLLREH